MFESQNSETRQAHERLVSALEHMQVQNGTGLGVLRSNRRCWYKAVVPCKCSMETSRNCVKKFKVNDKVQFSEKAMN